MKLQRIKERLQEALPLSLKLSLKRWLVAPLRAAIRLAAYTVNVADDLLRRATSQGLDIPRAWDVKARPQAPYFQPWGAADFLFLMKAISGQKPSEMALDQPVRTSIIIPVVNQADHLFQCLRSLMREIDSGDTEVIVVNNASCDATKHLLAYLGEVVRVIEHTEHLGLVEASHRGAAAARGRYLVFLNHATVVLPGWLKHLVETVERSPSAGAVGSMILSPEWIIEEAGAIVWKTAEALHYGRGKSPADQRFNFAREVDYCAGASLLIRKEIFDRLGGFDQRFALADDQAADLCFGVRALGSQVIYQPASRLIHDEGLTAGTGTQTVSHHLPVVHREQFFEKWRDVLEREHYDPDPAIVEVAANRKRGPYIMIFDDRIPTPDRDSGSVRMFSILKALAQWSKPVFVYTSQRAWPDYEQLLWREGIETVSALEYRRLLKKRKVAAVILSRPLVAEAMLPTVRRAARHLKIVFDMVDAHFIRYEREYQLTGREQTAREAKRYRQIETRLARSSDLIWCVSSEDKKVMEREVPGVRIEVIPNIHRLQDRGQSFDERQHLLFVGNFLHRPNSDAVHFFMKEIHPLIRQSIPAVKFYVVGDHAPPEIKAYESEQVRVLGYVPDLDPLFQRCRVLIAPLRFGAGMKGKIGEALSYGLPVVTTSIGAEGIGLRHAEEAMIADAPQEFADAVTLVYRDRALWQRLSDQGYGHIEKHFTPQVIGKMIHDSLTEADGSDPLEQHNFKGPADQPRPASPESYGRR